MPRDCPDCHAQGSVVHDTTQGCIVCEECGIVLRYGLEESGDTAFNEGQEGGLDEGGPGGAAPPVVSSARGAGSSAEGKNSRLNAYRKHVTKALRLLHEKTGVFEGVIETATRYAFDFSGNSQALNVKNDRPEVLAAGAFALAGAKFHLPVQTHEIIRHLEGDEVNSAIRPSQVEDMKTRIVAVLELKEEVDAVTLRWPLDLGTLYLQRLGIFKDPYPLVVSLIARRLPEAMGDHNTTPSVRTCVAIYLAFCSSAICTKVLNTVAKKGDDAKKFLEDLLRVSYETEAVKRTLQQVSAKSGIIELFTRELLTALAEKKPQGGATGNTAAAEGDALAGAGRKRPREGEAQKE